MFSLSVKAISVLDVLHTVLRSSPPPREQVVTVFLDRGVEQLYCLVLKSNYGDEARERVFRVRFISYTFIIYMQHFLDRNLNCLTSQALIRWVLHDRFCRNQLLWVWVNDEGGRRRVWTFLQIQLILTPKQNSKSFVVIDN